VHTAQFRDQAAVLIAVAKSSNGEEAVLLTKRAEHLTLHSGEVAFPGGKWEHEDSCLRDTALRESQEEVGLMPSRVDVFSELPAAHTRLGMKVTPYVGHVDSQEGLEANDNELQSFLWIPLNFLLEDCRTRTDIFVLSGREYWAPVYDWMDYTIWGFTARVMVDFMNRVYNRQITRNNPAPEIPYTGA